LPETNEQRRTAGDASDIFLTLSINTLLVDTLIVTWWGHDADTVAYQMALINIETLAFNTAIWGLVAGFASRERPYGREICGDNDDERPGSCGSNDRFRSFYSGHASTSFAAAGATCMHHAYLPLYGGGAPDALACGFAVAVAGATATMRVVADRHWLSDVLTGAAVGTFTGLTVPYFLHYRGGNLPEAAGDEISVNLVPMPTGAMMMGAF
jgi:membrane-associated phospholipid phosphatase